MLAILTLLVLVLSACSGGPEVREAVVAPALIQAINEPPQRASHTAIWTGEGMMIWGGKLGKGDTAWTTGGAIYYPGSGKWFALPREGQESRFNHTAVWTGIQMIVWGGIVADSADATRMSNGHMLDMEDEKWFPVTGSQAPAARSAHTAVWTGERMIVWGGESQREFFADGGLYDLEQDKWERLPPEGAPEVRSFHTAVWTGGKRGKMIVWGGLNSDGALGDGAIYDPATRHWRKIAKARAPRARYGHTVVWTGNKMIVWGGRSDRSTYLADGGVYDPATDKWEPLEETAALTPRELHTATWTGKEMVIWGGFDGRDAATGGAAYDPKTHTWTRLKARGKTPGRFLHTAVWTGNGLLVWGGRSTIDKFVKKKQSYVVKMKGGKQGIMVAAPRKAQTARRPLMIGRDAGH